MVISDQWFGLLLILALSVYGLNDAIMLTEVLIFFVVGTTLY